MTSEVRYQDDLYRAVNGAWTDQAVIPDDKSSTGGFQDLADEVEEKMMADFSAIADGKKNGARQVFCICGDAVQTSQGFQDPRRSGLCTSLAATTFGCWH